MAEKEEKDRSALVVIVLVVVPVVLFFALDYTVLPYWKSGDVEEARFISTPDGERLFVFESVSDGEDSTLERLKVYDPADLLKKPVQTYTRDDVMFRGYAGGRLWFESHDHDVGWHARDPKTLEITVTEQQLASADSRLRKIHDGSFRGDGLYFSTLDGYELRVDAETLAVTEAPKDRASRNEPDIENYEAILPGDRKLSFEGQPRRQMIQRPVKEEWGAVPQKVVLGTETFLDPRFLGPRRGDGVFVLRDPESVIVSHHKTVEYSSPLSISRVATDGHVLWTRSLGDENDVEEIALSGDFLVVVTEEHIRSLFIGDGSIAAMLNN